MPRLDDEQAAAIASAESVVTGADEIKFRRIRWLWKGRLALHYLSLWSGESSIGKSTFACWMVAQLTHGELEGRFYGEPSDVLIVANEDAREDTWGPRLAAAGADLSHAHFLDVEPGWNLHDGVPLIERALAEYTDPVSGDCAIRLLFVDSMLDHMPDPKGGETVNSTTFVRRALAPLSSLCKERAIAGLLSTHPPKTTGGSFQSHVTNSAAFVQVTRVGLLFGWHPEDLDLPDQERRRVLLRPSGGSNIGRDPGSHEFSIRVEHLRIEGEIEEVPRVTDPRPSQVTFRDLVSVESRWTEGNKPLNQKQQIRAIIDELLADGKWHESAPIKGDLLLRGFKKRTVEDSILGLSIKRDGGRTWWAKPGTHKDSFEQQLKVAS